MLWDYNSPMMDPCQSYRYSAFRTIASMQCHSYKCIGKETKDNLKPDGIETNEISIMYLMLQISY